MRLRNVKNAKDILENYKYFISDVCSNKNEWSLKFGNKNPIMLEIGMGKGDFIIGMAKAHPEWNFIGIEKYESVLVRAVEKLEKEDITNVRVMAVDAKNLEEYFGNEIDTIYLNFSDPWPKKRHFKRRLTYKDFLKTYDGIFKSGARIILKTDNDSFFESSLISLNNYGYVFDLVILDLWSTERENVKTEYEIKFASKGFKIKYLEAHK